MSMKKYKVQGFSTGIFTVDAKNEIEAKEKALEIDFQFAAGNIAINTEKAFGFIAGNISRINLSSIFNMVLYL